MSSDNKDSTNKCEVCGLDKNDYIHNPLGEILDSHEFEASHKTGKDSTNKCANCGKGKEWHEVRINDDYISVEYLCPIKRETFKSSYKEDK